VERDTATSATTSIATMRQMLDRHATPSRRFTGMSVPVARSFAKAAA
jgi:hypothetical protein